MIENSFQDLFCRQQGVSPDCYEKHILRHTLYPHARWLHGIVRLIAPDHFAADLDLVRNVARIKRLRDFRNDVDEFLHHPANRGMLRRTFNVRISTKRLRRMVKIVLHSSVASAVDADDRSAAPFPMTREDLNKGESRQHAVTA